MTEGLFASQLLQKQCWVGCEVLRGRLRPGRAGRAAGGF